MNNFSNIIKNDANALLLGRSADFDVDNDTYELFDGEEFGSFEYFTKRGALVAIERATDRVIYFPEHSAPYSRGYDVFGNVYLLTYFRYKELKRDFAEPFPEWLGKATFRGAIAKPYETRVK